MKNFAKVTNQYEITILGTDGATEEEVNNYIDGVVKRLIRDEDEYNTLFYSIKVKKINSTVKK